MVLCILQTRLISCHDVGQSKSTFSDLINLYTNKTKILCRLLFAKKTIASKFIYFQLLDKFRTLIMSSSQVSQKTTLLNCNVFYINRTEILCGSIFTKKSQPFKINFFELLDKFRILMTSSSKVNQKLIFSNLNMKSYILTKRKFSEDRYLLITYSLSLQPKNQE